MPTSKNLFAMAGLMATICGRYKTFIEKAIEAICFGGFLVTGQFV